MSLLKTWDWLSTAGDMGTPAAAGAMAHRKGLMTVRMGTIIFLAILFAALMAGRVVLLNQVTNMRVRNAQLSEQKSFLETRHAALQARWNHVTRPEVVCARAHDELGLIQPRTPDPVLVRVHEPQRRSRWNLPGWLPALAGGETAHAQDLPPAGAGEGMIRLYPDSPDQGPSSPGGRS